MDKRIAVNVGVDNKKVRNVLVVIWTLFRNVKGRRDKTCFRIDIVLARSF